MNRLDRESLDFHTRVRERFQALANAAPGRWTVLDATLPPERLEDEVWHLVEPRIRG
jgi:dTMP kinase